MTTEEKQLLLKDLSARLPYGVLCCVNFKDGDDLKKGVMKLSGMFTNECYFTTETGSTYTDDFEPYLRPMDTMTEEEAVEYFRLQKDYEYAEVDSFTIDSNKCLCAYVDNAWCRYCWCDISNIKVLDWLLEKHFDFRGLIWYELALPAPEGMYDFK